jgi:predicted XRE-type DNA-binding protein
MVPLTVYSLYSRRWQYNWGRPLAEIIGTLDKQSLSMRKAQVRTGIAAADFSRIRKADSSRFTIDRLMTVINRLGSRVKVYVKVKRQNIAA